MAANLLFGIGGPPVVHVRGLVDEMTASIRPALLVLAAGVVCVLLIPSRRCGASSAMVGRGMTVAPGSRS